MDAAWLLNGIPVVGYMEKLHGIYGDAISLANPFPMLPGLVGIKLTSPLSC
jgi:hypothetical protein